MILVPEKIRERERERGESGFSFPLEEKDGDREGGGRSKLYDGSLCMLN